MTRSLPPSPWLPLARPIARVVRDLPGVFTFTFDVPEGFSFRPGQFDMLYAYGVGEVPISISGDPADPTHLVHTIRAVGPTTRALEALEAGSIVGVRGPYGSAWPVDEAKGRDVLFVAGGLGLAPLRPAILDVLANRGDYGQVRIFYGARSPEEILYRDEVQQWRGRFDCEVHATVDRAGRDWHGHVGVVTRLLEDVPVRDDDAVFVCGPEIMMKFVVRELDKRGLPRSRMWVSLERSMKCGVGLCGHCQLGGSFVCKDGPVYRFDRVADLFFGREI